MPSGAGRRSRRLVLLRHAKSAWPYGVPDHERPLSGRGRRNALATGEWFATEGPRPDAVLCSDAVRTRHTWEIVASCLPGRPGLSAVPALYRAHPETVLDVARAAPPAAFTVVLVGHEPAMSAATLLLAGEGSDPAAMGAVRTKFPTNGIAVLAVSGPWASLAPGTARLLDFAVPRADRRHPPE